MKREELAALVAQRLDKDEREVLDILKTAFSIIKRNVKKGEDVNIQSFGNFTVEYHYRSDDDLWCKLHKIKREPYTAGYSPDAWIHTQFYPSTDWRTFGEYYLEEVKE